MTIKKGIFAQVEVCPKCEDEWIDENGYESLYQMFSRKTFKIGGSLAVRIPKELAKMKSERGARGIKSLGMRRCLSKKKSHGNSKPRMNAN